MPPSDQTVVSAGAVLTPTGLLSPGRITVEHGRIARVEAGSGLPGTTLVSPGFVDLQVNGMDDVDCATADGSDWDRLDDLLVATGVTAWLPTLVSQSLDRYGPALERIEGARRRAGPRPAVLGAHLEGPFLGGRPGAHRPDAIVPADPAWIGRLPDTVRLLTLAPEQDEVVAAIEACAEREIVVSIGHSAADFATAAAAIDAGARMATHLFNGMSPLHHRDPGIAGAALTDDRVTAGLIADLVHVHPAMLRTAFRVKGASRIVLVTDAVGWRAGTLGRAGISMGDGAPRLPDGTLAGSALTMDRAVRNVVDVAGIPPADALRAASSTPAAVLRDTSRGRIEVGARADLVELDTDDLAVRRTIVGGVTVWER